MTCNAPHDENSLVDWWHTAKQNTPKAMQKGLASATMLVPWMFWKQRNACVFEGEVPSIRDLCAKIKEDARSWATAGAKGLRDVLPTTWDVH
jgi:hypothetical protein